MASVTYIGLSYATLKNYMNNENTIKKSLKTICKKKK